MSMRTILANMLKADYDYDLILDGDKIAVGLSGGKDSTLLLYALLKYQQLAKHKLQKNFTVAGIHIDLGFGEEDMTPMFNFFKNQKMDVDIYCEKSKVANILNLYLKNGHIQCSRCSQLKKGAVIKVAKQHCFNKVCFGHHSDDAIETLLLNMLFTGKIATFEPKMYLDREEITFIRPFIYCSENEIINTAKSLNLPRLKSGCPVDGKTKRANIKALLNNLENEYPNAKKNLLKAIHNPKQIKLWLPKK